MPLGIPTPAGSPDSPAVIQAAFAGGPYGRHGLYAVVDTIGWLQGPPARATRLPIDRHLEVQGRFYAADGNPAGEFRRALYCLDGEWEVWLGGLEIWQVHHGRGTEFQEHSLEVMAAAGAMRARLNAGRLGAYLWAKRWFDFDNRRLPGWGTIMGVGYGGYRVVLPEARGPQELRRILVDELIKAAFRGRQITRIEAAVLRSLRATRPRELAEPHLSALQAALVSVPPHRRIPAMEGLPARVLMNRAWPGVRNLGVPTFGGVPAPVAGTCDR